MRHRTWRFLGVSIALVSVVTVISWRFFGGDPRSRSQSAAAQFADMIQDADEVVLFEGLPHQRYEADALASEKEKPTVEFLRYPFYEEPLSLSEADAKTLTIVFSNPAAFQFWRRGKKCGGFHPDYALVWKDGTTEYVLLVCFGCGELKTLSPKGESRFDIGSTLEKAVSEILMKYRKNRPSRRIDS